MKSDILRQEHTASVKAAKAMTPKERLVAFFNHSQLVNRFYEAGKKFRSSSVSTASKNNLKSEEHTSELQSQFHLVCRLLLEKTQNTKRRPPWSPTLRHTRLPRAATTQM